MPRLPRSIRFPLLEVRDRRVPFGFVLEVCTSKRYEYSPTVEALTAPATWGLFCGRLFGGDSSEGIGKRPHPFL